MQLRLFKPDYQIDGIDVTPSRIYPDEIQILLTITCQNMYENWMKTKPLTQTNSFPYHGKKATRYALKRDRLLKKSPQKLSLTLYSDFNIAFEPRTSPRLEIYIQKVSIHHLTLKI